MQFDTPIKRHSNSSNQGDRLALDTYTDTARHMPGAANPNFTDGVSEYLRTIYPGNPEDLIQRLLDAYTQAKLHTTCPGRTFNSADKAIDVYVHGFVTLGRPLNKWRNARTMARATEEDYSTPDENTDSDVVDMDVDEARSSGSE